MYFIKCYNDKVDVVNQLNVTEILCHSQNTGVLSFNFLFFLKLQSQGIEKVNSVILICSEN
jgi:hypothetical protein